jgi:hypothetical protein
MVAGRGILGNHGRINNSPATGLITDVAVGTGVVGSEERSDDNLARLDERDCAADILDDTAVLVPLGVGWAIGWMPRYGHKSGSLCLAKIGNAFEINNIQRGRVTCCMYEIQSSRSFGEGQV